MAQNRGFADWLASLAATNAQAGDHVPIVQGGVSKRTSAGQAGGIATLDGSNLVAQATAAFQAASTATNITTNKAGDNELVSFIAQKSGPVIMIASGEWTRSNGTPRGAYEIYYDGNLIQRDGVATDQIAYWPGLFVAIFSVAKGGVISMRAGIWPGQEDGTKELKIWSHKVRLLEFGAT